MAINKAHTRDIESVFRQLFLQPIIGNLEWPVGQVTKLKRSVITIEVERGSSAVFVGDEEPIRPQFAHHKLLLILSDRRNRKPLILTVCSGNLLRRKLAKQDFHAAPHVLSVVFGERLVSNLSRHRNHPAVNRDECHLTGNNVMQCHLHRIGRVQWSAILATFRRQHNCVANNPLLAAIHHW